MVDPRLQLPGRGYLDLGAPELGDIGGIEQRHGAAGRLLETAIGIERELAQEPRYVEIGQRPEARQQLARAGQEAGERRGIELHRLAGLEALGRALQHRELRRPDEDYGAVLEPDAVRSRDQEMDIGLADLIAVQRQAEHRMSAGIEMLLDRRLAAPGAAEGGAAHGGEGELIIARRA